MRSWYLKSVLAGCAGMMFAGIAGAEEPKSPDAVKRTFQTVMSELDQGGDTLIVMNVDGAVQELVDFVTKFISAVPAEDRDREVVQLQATVARLKTFLKKNGFCSATGVGMSSVPLSNGMSTVKMFISRDPAAAGLPLWRTISGGEPRRQMTLDFLPSDTALFRVVDVVPAQVLRLMKSGVNEVAPGEVSTGMSNGLAEASADIGMDVEKLVGSVGDEIFASVRLSTVSKIVLPARGSDKLEIPEPSLLMGCKVNDDTIMTLIRTLLTKNEVPVAESKVGNTVLVTVNGMPPSPIPFQPTFAMHGGCFLIGSTPKTVEDAIKAFDQKNGFAVSAEVKKAFRDLPAMNNGMAFLSPRVFQTIAVIQEQTAKSGGRNSPEKVFQTMLSDMLKAAGKEAIAFTMVNKKSGVLVQGTMPGGGSELAAGVMLAPVASAGMMAAIAVPAFMKARTNAGRSACINNLRLIEAAKDNYAIDYGGTNGTELVWNNLSIYIKDCTNKCFCPAAPSAKRSLKNYRMGLVGEEPKCLINPGHSLGRGTSR